VDRFATTKLSSRGQVVIPEEIRIGLGLKEGTQFVVIGRRDVVVLKAISAPSMEEFDELIGQAQKAARRSGMKKADVRKAIRRVRRSR
jgi:AbrB family looped-hinge helix DNA binding protein